MRLLDSNLKAYERWARMYHVAVVSCPVHRSLGIGLHYVYVLVVVDDVIPTTTTTTTTTTQPRIIRDTNDVCSREPRQQGRRWKNAENSTTCLVHQRGRLEI